jgi:tetratricopeptide (TPR) repeat protein
MRFIDTRTPIKHWLVPYEQNRDFTGRDMELDGLLQLFRESDRFHHRVAIYGLGGVGKTQLALEYAYRNRQIYDDVFWISGVDRSILLSGFGTIGEETKWVVRGEINTAEVYANDVIRSLNRRNRWLLVIDNLDDIAVIDRLLPVGSFHSHVLITTRNSLTMGIPADGFEVGVLPVKAAIKMLLLRATPEMRSHTDAEIAEASEIVTEMGCLPLAIEQAAGYIREGCKTISKFLSIYRDRRDHLLSRRPMGNWSYAGSVTTTWGISFEKLQDINPAANELMTLLAFLEPDQIPVEFLRLGGDGLDEPLNTAMKPGQLDDCLATLDSFSLIRRSQDNEIISIHRLVQAVIQSRVDQEKMSMWRNAALNLAYEALHNCPSEKLEFARKFCRQALSCAGSVDKNNWEVVVRVLMDVFVVYTWDSKWAESLDVARKCLDVCVAFDQDSSELTLEAMSRVASGYRSNGEFSMATECYERLLTLVEKRLGIEDAFTMSVVIDLGYTYFHQNRFEDAMRLYERVLPTVQNKETPLDSLRLNCRLAQTYSALGRHSEAAQLLEPTDYSIQAFKSSERHTLLDSEGETVLSSMEALADIYLYMGRVEEAVRLAQEILKTRRQTDGENSPLTLDAAHRLAMALLDQKNWSEAATVFEHVHKQFRATYTDHHPDTARAFFGLVNVYAFQDQWAIAAELCSRYHHDVYLALGRNDLYRLIVLRELAWCRFKEGPVVQGMDLLEYCYGIDETCLGKEHPETLTTLCLLSICYRCWGNFYEAERCESTLRARYSIQNYDMNIVFCSEQLQDAMETLEEMKLQPHSSNIKMAHRHLNA